MKKRSIKIFATGVSASFLFAGCMVKTQYAITNGTGMDVVVKSHHTEEEILLPKAKCKYLPHTAGHLTVYYDGGTWLYKDMSPLEFHNTDWMDSTWFIYTTKTVPLYISTNGCLYVIPTGKKKEIENSQPMGYPKQPFRETLISGQELK
ncbi:MAG: hypothetical protein ACOX9C_13235 [Kiritimatiellia bacterium]|jgi:hypothetical protein